MARAILETAAIVEVIKSYWHVGLQAPIYYYRDRDKREIDLLIIQNRRVYPVEVKKTASPRKKSFNDLPAKSR